MNPRRLFEVFRQEFAHGLRRPLYWVLVLIVAYFSFALARGQASIGSGNSSVGGTKAFITSEFAITQLMAMLVSIVYSFFIAIAAGMSVIRDDEQKVGELLHSTPMTPGEYVWGKFLAIAAGFVAILGLHVAMMMLLNHAMPHGENVEVIGPFVAANYLRPLLLFAIVPMVCVCGVAFATGALTRLPILVFALPIGSLLFGAFLLWEWSPSWLDPRLNQLLMLVDPAGIRWLNETWLNVDRGVEFYNHAHVGTDTLFWINRLVMLAAGLGAVWLTQLRITATVRGTRASARDRRRVAVGAQAVMAAPVAEPSPLARLAMRSQVPGFVSAALEVARVELRELRSQPGLYLFVPMILLQTLGSLVSTGAFDTPLLNTSGLLAVRAMNTLTLLICMLLLFYTVESLQRERSTGFGSIFYATPLRTGAALLGKALANTFVAVAILLATLVGEVIVLAVQGKASFEIAPFALVWGLLLTPTFLVWTTFVSAVFAATASRYATYALGLGAMVVTGFAQQRNHMNWVFNWDLWSSTRWSDISMFELDRMPLLLNRILALGLTALFIAVTVRLFPRMEADATRTVHRLRPAALGRTALSLVPFLIVPLGVGTVLGIQVHEGFQGGAERKHIKDYYRQNYATWAYAQLPALSSVNLDITLEPQHRHFTVSGEYDVMNTGSEPMRAIPVTGGAHWDSLHWTLDGADYKPEDRSKLFVFTPAKPLAPGEHARIGFRYEGGSPHGISKNGAGRMEFILPSSVVFTGFEGPTLVPIVGMVSEMAPEEKDRIEPRQYPDDYNRDVLQAEIASAQKSFNSRIKVTVPADFRVNVNGVLESETVAAGKRTAVYVTDHPIKIFNIIAGRWAERRGKGVVVYYEPKHTYNLDEMVQALEGGRKYFSEWFAPYPWRELRLSEFPSLATYAQAPPTNITFSENIGFLTLSKPKANAAFWVTAHETAHQWWGNMLTPGRGPGADVLSEGMSHFSTILLTEQVKGLEQRLAFCKQIEDRYGNVRQADSERPLTRIDDSRKGDGQIKYDKGGFTAWMMLQLIGRENMLAGCRDFIATWRDSVDHPVLQDWLVTMRAHAPDAAAYDAFVKQWYWDVVVPEYRFSDARAEKLGNEWEVHAKVKNAGTGTMPITIAAVRGVRFGDAKKHDTPWKDARTVVTLGPGQEREITIRCPFEPERVLADPDVQVLQLERSKATARVDVKRPAAASVAAVMAE